MGTDTRRIALIMRTELVEELDAYAQAHDITRTEALTRGARMVLGSGGAGEGEATRALIDQLKVKDEQIATLTELLEKDRTLLDHEQSLRLMDHEQSLRVLEAKESANGVPKRRGFMDRLREFAGMDSAQQPRQAEVVMEPEGQPEEGKE